MPRRNGNKSPSLWWLVLWLVLVVALMCSSETVKADNDGVVYEVQESNMILACGNVKNIVYGVYDLSSCSGMEQGEEYIVVLRSDKFHKIRLMKYNNLMYELYVKPMEHVTSTRWES